MPLQETIYHSSVITTVLQRRVFSGPMKWRHRAILLYCRLTTSLPLHLTRVDMTFRARLSSHVYAITVLPRVVINYDTREVSQRFDQVYWSGTRLQRLKVCRFIVNHPKWLRIRLYSPAFKNSLNYVSICRIVCSLHLPQIHNGFRTSKRTEYVKKTALRYTLLNSNCIEKWLQLQASKIA